MNERIEAILEHMLEDAQDVVMFAEKAGSFDAFIRDKMLRKAIIMSLLNIGELANHLPVEYTNVHSEIQWKRMVGMRNFAAHGYHTMNLGTVWKTAQTSIPALLNFLQTQLAKKDE